MEKKDFIYTYISQVSDVFNSVDEDKIDLLIDNILNSNKIFILGAGRSGLIMKAFGMRLVHLGLQAYVVGEIVTPSCNRGDLCIVGSGSGETSSIISITSKARYLEANIISITSSSKSTLARLSDAVIITPFRKNKLNFGQPMGSLFECILFFITEFIVGKIMKIRNIDSSYMLSIHANLE